MEQDELMRTIELGRDLEFLLNRPEFKRVILEGFCNNKVLDSLYSSVNYPNNDKQCRKKLKRVVYSGMILKHYLDSVIEEAENAKIQLLTKE